MKGVDWLPYLSPDAKQPLVYADCAGCQERTPIDLRQHWHCGFLQEEEWKDCNEYPVKIGNDSNPVKLVGICPGWVVRQRGVAQVCEAYAVLKNGAASLYFDEDTPAVVMDMAVRLGAAIDRHSAEQMPKPSK